jgi:hypothetical protein
MLEIDPQNIITDKMATTKLPVPIQSIFSRSCGFGLLGSIERMPRRRSAAPMGMLIRNIAGQPETSSKTPPIKGPLRLARATVPPRRPIAAKDNLAGI